MPVKLQRQLPNALTVVRIVLVPFFWWALVHQGGTNDPWRCVAWWIFVAAMVTDFADGYLARRWRTESAFGKLLDPIADKALIGAALIGLWQIGALWWILPVVILSREILVTIARLFVAHKVVVAASWGGKVKTVLQTLGLVLLIAPLSAVGFIGHGLGVVVLVVAAVVTWVTGYDYLRAMFGRRR